MHAGVLLVDKPQGWTSHQVVGRCRRLFGTRKVGHAGTLDPMATGLLIVGVNRATRLLGHLAGHDKTYLATIRLGQASSTDDADGELGEVTPATHLGEAAIDHAMAALRGSIEQVPSSVSAIKVGGKRAYARVRAGEEVELTARPVTVSRFEVTGRREAGERLDLDVVVDCSSGTYIRALARDLGAALGVGGHLVMLRRIRIGGFFLPETPVDLDADVQPPLVPMAEVARACFPVVDLDEQGARALGFGQRARAVVPEPVGSAGQTGVTEATGAPEGSTVTLAAVHNDELIALVTPDDEPGWVRPITVFTPATATP